MLRGHGGQFVAWVRRNVWILLFADLVLVGVAWRQRSWLGAVMAIVLTVVLLGAPPAGSVGRWLRRYRWLVGAFIFGAVNTVYGIWFTYDQSTATEWLPLGLIDFVEHWSPHFGPEALVLVFTVALLESSLKRHESRERLRRETLGGFLFVIRQCLQRDVYIDGGAAVILQDEWLALQQRAMERARLFSGEQLELFWECEKETEDLINTAANFAMIADALRRSES